MSVRPLLLGFIAFMLFFGISNALTYVSTCQQLGTYGETYVLSADLAGSYSGGVCIDIANDHITLDCASHSIKANNTSRDTTGIRVSGDDVVVKNCSVSGYSYDSYNGAGLLSSGNTNITVRDSSFDGNDIGVWVFSDNSSLLDDSASGNAYAGFAITDADRVNLTGDYANKNREGFRFLSADRLVLGNSRADNSDGSGFEFIGLSNARIERNNATGNKERGFYIHAYVPESNSNLTGNIADGNGGDGFLLTDDDHDRLIGNFATNNGNDGFRIYFDGYPSADSNTLIDNTATGNGFGLRCLPGNFPCPINGFLVEEANSTALYNNSATGNAGAGFFVYHASFTVLDGNNATENGEHGFWVSSHEAILRSLNNFTRNTALDNAYDGFFSQDDRNRYVLNNATGNGANGFEFAQPFCIDRYCSGNDNVLTGNTADSNGFGSSPYCQDPNNDCSNGFLMVYVNNTDLTGNSALSNAGHGFKVYSGSNNTMASDLAQENGGNGFFVDTSGEASVVSSYNTLSLDRADGNDGDGYLIQDDHNTISRSNASGNGRNGFSVVTPTGCEGCNAQYNNLSRDIASDNTGDGFHIFEFSSSPGSASFNTLDDNTAYGNGNEKVGVSGFLIGAPDTTIRRNTAYQNLIYGFDVESSIASRVGGVTLSGNTAYGHHYCGKGCSGAGFKFAGTTVAVYSPFQADMDHNIAYDNDYGVFMHTGTLSMSLDRLFNDTYDFQAFEPSARSMSRISMSQVVFDRDSGDLHDYTTLSLDANLTYDTKSGGQGFFIDHAIQPTPDLPFGTSFHNKFVQISDLCQGEGCLPMDISDATWHWSLAETSGYTDIQLWEFTSERWVLRNDSADNSNRRVSLQDVSDSGIYALLANYTPPVNGGGEGGQTRLFSVDAEPSCSGALITVQSGGLPVSEARVLIGDAIYSTNASGQIQATMGCGQVSELYASKEGGYIPFGPSRFSSASCDQCPAGCVSDSQCPQGDTCQDGQCAPRPGCQSDRDCPSDERCVSGQCAARPGCLNDSDCASNQTCDAHAGACMPRPVPCVGKPECCIDDSPCPDSESCQGGSCQPVQSGQCGHVSGHRWVPYQGEELTRHCGETGCPSCQQKGNVSGADCHVGQACSVQSDAGYLVVAYPDGTIISEGLWGGGKYPIDSSKPGKLIVTLYSGKGGEKLASIELNILPGPATTPEAAGQNPLLQMCPLPLMVLLAVVLLALLAYYLLQRNKKK